MINLLSSHGSFSLLLAEVYYEDYECLHVQIGTWFSVFPIKPVVKVPVCLSKTTKDQAWYSVIFLTRQGYLQVSSVCTSLSFLCRSFAYLTVKDRLPTILTKVIDTIHRNKDKFLEEYGKVGFTGCMSHNLGFSVTSCLQRQWEVSCSP